MRKRKDMLIVLPNLVTGLRMIGTFLLLFTKAFSSVFYVVYSICGITDVCDGFLARRTGTTSEFGAKLDSVADLMFYTVMMIKILPALAVRLPGAIWYWVGGILILRLGAYLVAAVKFRCFASIHTYLNKLTGLCVFIIPYFIGLPFLTLFCMAVCGIATIASVEELIMHICTKEYHAETKTLIMRKMEELERKRNGPDTE